MYRKDLERMYKDYGVPKTFRRTLLGGGEGGVGNIIIIIKQKFQSEGTIEERRPAKRTVKVVVFVENSKIP